MRSIEDLTDQVRDRGSRIHFEEAMRAYSAGAYRASTILLWTSVLQDITEKLRILADSGDGAAAVAIGEVDAARASRDLRRLQVFENGLLDRAWTEFELITAREFDELSRLRTDRNLCAHPAFLEEVEDAYRMTPEQVRAHARVAVESVLSQPPVVGRALVGRFIADTKSGSWPDDSLIEFLRARYFNRARPASIRAIATVAVKAAIRPPDGDNLIARRCTAAIQAAAQIDERLVMATVTEVLSKWRDQLADDDLLRVLGALGTFRETWTSLGAENVVRLRQLLQSSTVDKLLEARAFASGPPVEGALSDAYVEAIGRFTPGQLERATRRAYPTAQWIPRVLDEVSSVFSWRGGERAMRLALAVADSLTLDDVHVLASEFVRNDQIHHAADMPQLILRIVEATDQVPGARGVWQEALHEYVQSYEVGSDPGGYYDYSEVRALLSDSGR